MEQRTGLTEQALASVEGNGNGAPLAGTARVSVVIPAFNEESGVSAVVQRVSQVLGEARLVHEIIVVDDGSTDDTARQAEEAGAAAIPGDP